MSDLFAGEPIPIEEQIAEVEREIAMRRRVYPGWVRAGRMDADTADRRIAAMQAVLDTLRRSK